MKESSINKIIDRILKNEKYLSENEKSSRTILKYILATIFALIVAETVTLIHQMVIFIAK